MTEPLRHMIYRAVVDRVHALGWYVLEDEPDAGDDRELRLTLRPWEREPNTGDDPA